MIEIYGNNSATTLAAGIGSGSVSCTLLAGTGSLFPSPAAGQFFRMTFTDALTGNVREIVYVTARSGDTCTIVRAQEGTTALAWLAGDKAADLNTAGAMANLSQQVQVQQNLFNYSPDTGSANAYALALTPNNLSTPTVGAIIYFVAANPNTGPSTVTVNGGPTYPILGQARLALQGGEINKFTAIAFDATLSSYILLFSTGGAPQAPTTTKTNQVLTYGSAVAFFAKLNGDATVPFATSFLSTPVISSPSSPLILRAPTGGQVSMQNTAGTTLIPTNGAPGQVGTSSTQYVTGAQLQNVYKVGELKMWYGLAANIASVWGPGWQLADGTNGSPNMTNRVPIAAGGLYGLGATGGQTQVVLSTAQMPAHNHAIYDPGHAHAVYDPGHNHGVNDPGHAHGVYDPGHQHGQPNQGSAQAGSDNGGVGVAASTGFGTSRGQNPVSPSGTGIGIYGSGTGIYLNAATTGIAIYGAVTGIQTYNTGGATPVPTMMPYVAVLFIYYSGIGA
jgi:hypothetical protein